MSRSDAEPDSLTVKARIREHALSVGFDGVAVAPLELPAHHEQTFERWVQSGGHAGMHYLDARLERRQKVADMLPGAKCVICFVSNYHRANSPVDMTGAGLVSRYAVTRDYHKIITGWLKQMDRFISGEFGESTRYSVDTGPILERGFAESAGLGYIGKNTCLITQEFGSWVFLSEMLTTLDLPVDTPSLKLSCGRCRRCIDDCPTAAISEDRTVDSNRCISYLTIENRGGIPEELRRGVGRWLFGCDICQEVCPHNSRESVAASADFREIRIKGRTLPLLQVLEIESDDAFLELFAGTPLMRAKRRGLIRNACVVAGNSGDRSLLPALRRISDGDDEMLAEHAGWAISEIEDPRSV